MMKLRNPEKKHRQPLRKWLWVRYLLVASVLVSMFGSQATGLVVRTSASPQVTSLPAQANASVKVTRIFPFFTILALEIREYVPNMPPGSGPLISNFSYLINVDNTGDYTDPDPMMHPSLHPMESYSPIVAAGDEATADSIVLPDGRFLISVRGLDDPATGEIEIYKLWGKHLRLPDDAPTGTATVLIELIKEPLPLSNLRVFAFRDGPGLVDGVPNDALEPGLEGFHVVIHDAVGEVTVDWFGNPICTQYDGNPLGSTPLGDPIPFTGGFCVTDQLGEAYIPNLGYGRYDVFVIPPEPNAEGYIQTTTFEGTLAIDAWLEEGTDGRGAIGEFLVEPGVPTAFFFGFTTPCEFGNTSDLCPNNDIPGSGTIMGTARNLVAWPPFEQLGFGEPVKEGWVALNAINPAGDNQVYAAPLNPDGTFSITGVPDGTYQVVIWDEPLDYIIAFRTVTVDSAVNAGLVDMGDYGVFRWFGWVSGMVFMDNGLDSTGAEIGDTAELAGNGVRDCANAAEEATCEVGISNTDLLIRFRDGSVKQTTFTDDYGFYEFPEARSILGRFEVAEVGFGRFARTGHSMHNDHFAVQPDLFPDSVEVIPGDLGGDLLLAQLTWEGKRSIIDWGKREYDIASGEHGGIAGAVIYATTRNEFDARLAAAEDYEPGIPAVPILLWGAGPDGFLDTPDTPSGDDVLLNAIESDSWIHPTGCDVQDKNGIDLTDPVALMIAAQCIEVPMVANETHDSAWDGGWAIEESCFDPTGLAASDPNGDADFDGVVNRADPDLLLSADDGACDLLTPGDYMVQVLPPPFYQILKEEDQNTDEGDDLIPLEVLPPPCVGEPHLVLDSRNPFDGQMMPLCDKKLVTLEAGQNAAAEFYLFTTDEPYVAQSAPDQVRTSWNTFESVPVPARFFGLVEDDITLNTNPNSITYGEKRGVPHIPIGIFDYSGRLLTTTYTDENGFYEVLVPSTYTALCPTPGGVCPGMYVLVINDPGSPGSANAGFSNAYLTEPLAFEVWPGKMRWTDTPVDPINALVCSLPPGPEVINGVVVPHVPTPEIFAISQPYVYAADLPATFTLTGTRFGRDTRNPEPAYPPGVWLGDTELTVTSWTPATPFDVAPVFEDVVTFEVPAGTTPGAYQLMVENATGGRMSVNGLTFHVLGAGYNPPLVTVNSDPLAGADYTTIQSAINGAPDNALVVVEPGAYHENLILHRNLKLQGYGPGGAVGAPPAVDAIPAVDPDDPPPTVGGEEPFAHILGSVIDGRFFEFVAANRLAWEALLATLTWDGPAVVPSGAGITVVAEDGEFNADYRTQIDGFGITASRGFGGGGVYAHAYARNLLISNNIFDANSGIHGGAISLGQPRLFGGDLSAQNTNISIHHNRMVGNGGVNFAGAVGIFNGADGYEFAYNDVCGNTSLEYGGGLSHFGNSPNASIHDNRIYFNEAFDEGGGILVGGDPADNAPLGLGSGAVTIERNLVEANQSNDDGGGIMLLQPLTDTVIIRNNMIAANLATDFGGGIHLDNASSVEIVNNSIANNVSTSTAVDADTTPACIPADGFTCPHAAGLTSSPYGAGFDPGDGTTFSDPVLFNNIFWGNESFYWGTLPPPEPGLPDDGTLGLISAGIWDMEVVYAGAGDCFSPRYSLLSVAYGSGATCSTTHPSNIVGQDPLFLNSQLPMVQASLNRRNLTEIFTTIARPEGTLVGFSDYHIQADALSVPGSPAIDAGTPALGAVSAPFDDFDMDARPSGAGFDIGADEVIVPPVQLYFSTALNSPVPGVAGPYDDADIYTWNGVSYSRIFDASLAGFPGGLDFDALLVVDNDTFYFSPLANLGAFAADEDIVLYNAGLATLFFDGSDVGLTAASENVDAFEILPDGSVVISTFGNVSVPGLGGTHQDEDLLRCVGAFGTTTTCSWSMYFDASDIGLTFPVLENVVGVAVQNGTLYMSTLGLFTVTGGFFGTGLDVFACNTPTLGSIAACASFSTYFNGLANGLFPLDTIDGFDIPVPPAEQAAILLGSHIEITWPTPLDAPATLTVIDPGQTSDNTYTWDFGDGATGSGQTVQHTYEQAQAYVVTVTVSGPAGQYTLFIELEVGYRVYLPLIQR